MLTDETMEKLSGLNVMSGNRITDRFSRWIDGLSDRYSNLLRSALKRRRRVIVIVTVMMILSLGAIPLVGAEFMPSMDSGEISVNVEMDKGSMLSGTDEVADQIEQQIKSIPEVDLVFSSIGSDSFMLMGSGTNTDTATMYVKLCPRNERKRDVNTVSEDIRTLVSDIPRGENRSQCNGFNGRYGCGRRPDQHSGTWR